MGKNTTNEVGSYGLATMGFIGVMCQGAGPDCRVRGDLEHMSSFEYFILGILISIPIAVAAPFGANAIDRWRATRSEKQGMKRIQALEREYATVKNYHDDSIKLLSFIGARILLLTVLWIGQSILDVIFGFANNGFNVAGVSLNYTIFPVNTNVVSDWLSATASLVDVIVLTVIFRIGIRAYRIVRKAMHFDAYEISIKNELATIREKDMLPGKGVNV